MESEVPPDPSKGAPSDVPSNPAGAEALAPAVPAEALIPAVLTDEALVPPIPVEALDEANPAGALAAAVASDLPPGTIAVEPPEPVSPDVATASILVADDHPATRRYLERLLGQRWNVESAPNGQAALEAARARRPDLIISDVSMPVLDGFGLLRELRADARTAAIPILFLSGEGGEETRVQGLRAGATDYLVKPFSSRELIAKVESQIELSVAHRRMTERMASRDAFYATASHDLRNPINSLQLQLLAILLRLEQGPRTEDLEWMHTRVSKANDQASRVIRLLDTMLDVSRMANGRLPLVVEDVNLAEVVSDVVDRLDPIEKAQITVRLDSTPGRWDRLRLDQVVTNLVSNALKYGDGHPIEIVVTGAGDRARLEVSDQGIGVAAEHQQRIFERFERAVADNSYAGFGMGLWITSRIVEEFGGTLALQSAPGEGSTFIIELPIARP
jgi:signal transduction histidine kinase